MKGHTSFISVHTNYRILNPIQPGGGGLADVVRGRQSIRAVQLSRREQGKWCFGRVPRGGAGLRRRGSRHRCRARWVNVNAGSQRVSGDTASLAVLAPDEEASEAQQRKEEHYPNHRAGHGTHAGKAAKHADSNQ